MGTINQVLSVFGKLSTNILGLSNFLGTPDLWPILVSILAFPSVVHFFLTFLVESPKYLYIHKNDKNAAELGKLFFFKNNISNKLKMNIIQIIKALKNLRNNDMLLVENEMKQLMIEKKQSREKIEVAWKDFIIKKHLRRPLVITIVIQFGQNLTGIDAVSLFLTKKLNSKNFSKFISIKKFVFYSTDIFKNVGLKDNWPNYATILLSNKFILEIVKKLYLLNN